MYFPVDGPWHLKRGCVTNNLLFDLRTHCKDLHGPGGGFYTDCCIENFCNNHSDSHFLKRTSLTRDNKALIVVV